MTYSSSSRVLMIGALTAFSACAGADSTLDEALPGAVSSSTSQDLRRATEPPSLYLQLRRDVRRCAFPLCGGFFVRAVNRFTTPCADGMRRSECYVSELELTALGLSEEQAAQITGAPESFLLEGHITPQATDFGTLGRLEVSEAWQGHAGTNPAGLFARVKNEGIVCITSPCLSFSAQTLNLPLPAQGIAEIDLEGISDDPSDAFEQLNAEDGLLVAARPTLVRGPAGHALGLDASEYYVPVSPQAVGRACGSRGLPECPEGTFCAFPPEADCGRADAPGTCARQPDACIALFDPVCGCDGVTHGNACSAASAGVSIDFDGPCEETPEP